MNTDQVNELLITLYKDIFGREYSGSFSEAKAKFAFDIPLPKKITCALSGKPTWSFSAESNKIASQHAIADAFKKDEWMRTEKPLRSIDDILKAWNTINFITGEKYINSTEVTESDGVYNSREIFQSTSIFDSKKIVCSYKIFDCDSMFASRDSASCALGIRVKESLYCTSCFEVSWSNKVSRSLYIHDGFDLYECLFCSHLRSKKYCIANMQFEKEEYFRLKKMVLDWILK